MSRKKLDLVLENVRIESVAAEGKAVARVDGEVVFVEFAVPGDLVDIRVLKKKKNHMEGRIERIVEPSPDRLEPFCKHFGVCGGCRWQPLPYPLQLEAKRNQVYDQLVRLGHLEVPQILPTIGSSRTVRYRNKLEFTASSRRWTPEPPVSDGGFTPALGFHVGKFFDKVLDIECCHLQKEPSNAVRNFLREYCLSHSVPFYDIRANRGVLRNVIVRTAEDGAVMVIVCFGEDFDGRDVLLDALCNAFPDITSLYYVINGKCNDTIADLDCILYRGEEVLVEHMEGLGFRIGPKSFYQTNTLQALELYRVARDFAALSGGEVVYDLYTGTGTIAQFVSNRASKVIGIEYVKAAVEDARRNAVANGITNCEFYDGDMAKVLTAGFIAEHGRPDVIIVDPPRAGMHPDVVKTILEAAPERIVYVSCNPASQARDLAVLSSLYRITAVQPVDMFPHTQHVENVCKLERR
ncbi:MAG: 23S rRNA (uracil(1939)-C(5))-methyltransferase RlmD [Bacteroidales bacterium]|nr:23S rRNA (uracil(1939)-C(5))-methyltransferase RlmD [Bacteroidales bacterium]